VSCGRLADDISIFAGQQDRSILAQRTDEIILESK
jgi:hypothetical protein